MHSSRASLSSPCCAPTADASWYASLRRFSVLTRKATGVFCEGDVLAKVSAAARTARSAATAPPEVSSRDL